MAKKKEATPRRKRRGVEEMIAALEAQITSIKTREARRQAKADPAARHVSAAIRAIDKALDLVKDANTKKALGSAHSSLSSILDGDLPTTAPATRTRRSASDVQNLAEALLRYVNGNPGQRGEQIAAALGTDSKTMRPVMKRLIAEGKIATEGQRRGMTYAPV